MQPTDEKYLKISNFHIFLWLLKDTFWVLHFKWLSLFMIVPTLSVAIFLTYKLRKDSVELFHNLAICFWIAGNSAWMIDDYFFPDDSNFIPALFFVVGFLIVSYYYISLLFKKSLN